MKFNRDLIYRSYVLMRRIPHILEKVCFVPLKFDHHVVWDIHEKYLQFSTAPILPSKILHVINRRSQKLEQLDYSYIAELENIFSLLPREILKSKNYKGIKDSLNSTLASDKLRGLIFQSQGAFDINQKWFDPQLSHKIIQVCPAVLESRLLPEYFVDRNQVKFLSFASRYHEKGLHILSSVAEKLLKLKPHYQFTLVVNSPIDYVLPSNIHPVVMPRPTLEQRREFYTGHDFVVNLSLGDSLGVFLDSVRFCIPMIGYFGQHGKIYCPSNASMMLDNPIFIYGKDFLEKYNPFEFESYLKDLEDEKFFEKDKEILLNQLLLADNFANYKTMVNNLVNFTKSLSPNKWFGDIKEYYKEFN